ncbi:hypothetical protein A9Q99_14025 [Gammaproteobacteria bacterium 45_16_T64]|nr:hypothetical protein A9Q99_14025 [Gammaproteobacteria bacterium 45_16_T64]
MQLAKKKRWILASAVGSLLSTQSRAYGADWQAETAYRYYSETDRVTAMEPVLKLHKTESDGSEIDFSIAYDSLSGASPNGAAVSDEVQTFTSTSGAGAAETTTAASGYRSSRDDRDDDDDDDYEGDDEYGGGVREYTVQPGEIPLDPDFSDDRLSISLQYSTPATRTITTAIGGSYSSESDYLSMAINGGLGLSFNRKNTQLGLNLSLAHDENTPFGGVPTRFSKMSEPSSSGSSESKTIVETLISVTQILSPNAVVQLNYSAGMSQGYHTDPYKIITLLDENLDILDYVAENRPDQRTKHSVFSALKYHAFGDTIDLSYRYMWDDWAITSTTVDVKYRLNLGNVFIQPHYRHYHQEAANFYVTQLHSTDDIPDHASADYRLGTLTSTTYGVKVGLDLGKQQEISFRVESFQQEGESAAANLDAVISQINYKVAF